MAQIRAVDTVETFFLACFGFGVLFTLGSVVLGAAGSLHVGHVGHVGHAGHGGPAGHVGAHGHAGGHDLDGHGAWHLPHALHDLPLLNPSSMLGFLTWFGAAGYLLVHYADWTIWPVLLGALLAGALGWYLIARFLGLVLAGERGEMNPDEYRLEGTLGRITAPIPMGGTGEIVFSKAGVRRSEAARALGDRPITRGTEVVITRYADGFAVVQPWSEFLAARDEDAEKRQSV